MIAHHADLATIRQPAHRLRKVTPDRREQPCRAQDVVTPVERTHGFHVGDARANDAARRARAEIQAADSDAVGQGQRTAAKRAPGSG